MKKTLCFALLILVAIACCSCGDADINTREFGEGDRTESTTEKTMPTDGQTTSMTETPVTDGDGSFDTTAETTVPNDNGMKFFHLRSGECSVSSVGAYDKAEVVIPEYSPSGDKVVEIGSGAFKDCADITSVIFTEHITAIRGQAFEGCTSLKEISIPGNVTEIGGYAFSGCNALKAVTIPSTVQKLGVAAFEGCTGITEVIVESTSVDLRSAFSKCTELTKVTLGNISVLGSQAFSGCSKLKEINIPSSVKEIGVSAFTGCNALEEIKLPSGLVKIANSAFSGCISLKSIVIPDSVTTIERRAFFACYALERVTLGSGVKSIGESCFGECKKLSIYYNGTEAGWKKVDVAPYNQEIDGKVSFKKAETPVNTLTKQEALEIAKRLYAEHNQYSYMNVCCDGEFNSDDMSRFLTSSQLKNYNWTQYRITCCSSVTEVKAHVLRCLAPSMCEDFDAETENKFFTDDKNNLYIMVTPRGFGGGGGEMNVILYNEQRIVTELNEYDEENVLYRKTTLTIVKQNGHFVLSGYSWKRV